MTTSEAADEPGRSPSPGVGRSRRPRRRAAGIYGMIVTASVLASAGSSLGTLPLAVAVFVTLVVYWLAEEYAELAELASAGRPLRWQEVRTALKSKWPMVTASYVPLVTLLVARLAGASASTAALIALIVIVVLLLVYGWIAGRALALRRGALIGASLLAGAFGLLMVALKVSLSHLH
jgi:hypothetical protein